MHQDPAGSGGKTRPAGRGIICSEFAAASVTARKRKIGSSRAILLLSFWRLLRRFNA
jgi:hypothetical protein